MEVIVVLRKDNQKTELLGVYSNIERATQAAMEDKKIKRAFYRIIRTQIGETHKESPNETLY